MLSTIKNIGFIPQVYNLRSNNNVQQPQISSFNVGLSKDTVTFTGKSAPSMYKTVFEYLASEVLGSNKKYHVDGSKLSANNIGDAVKTLIMEDRLFLPFNLCVSEKIKWKSYIPQDVRVFSVGKINEARSARMEEWRNFLKYVGNPASLSSKYDNELVAEMGKDPSLRLVIWNAISSELKENNRHIPVPFNERALLETIKGFKNIQPMDRDVRCASPSFVEMYTHRLRDNLLMDMKLSDNNAVWVKVPSIKHDVANKERNIRMLETLSCRNWCTRSSVDKAEAALEDGDFYIYLQRGKSNLWEPLVGMTTSHGKIDQIQGIENNNIVPLNLVNEIKSFISQRNLKCNSFLCAEGPKATQAIMISEKLNEVDMLSKRTFAKAIKDNDDTLMLKFLGINVNPLEGESLQIGTYRPSYALSQKSGITVPYSMFGLDEDKLLRNVKVIDGDLNLYHKNHLFNSRLKQLPPNLERVTGKICLSAEQFERFGEDVYKLVGGNRSKVRIYSN